MNQLIFVQPNSKNNIINHAAHIYNFEPLGIYYLARMLGDVECVNVDLNVEHNIICKNGEDYLLKIASEQKSSVFAFSALTSPRTNKINELATLIKSIDSNNKIIVGGIHSSLMPSDFYGEYIDYIIPNNCLNKFTETIQSTDKEKICHKFDLDEFYANTFPLRSIGEKYSDHYQIAIGKPGKTKIKEKVSSIKVTAGCPYRCNFCCLWQLYPKYAERKIESVVLELKQIENKNIFFADDESMIDVKYMFKFADSIIENKIDKKYVMYARSDTVAKNEPLLEKWAEAGLRQIWIGIEGCTNSQLDRYNKKNNIENQEKAIAIARKYNVDVHATALVDYTFKHEDFDYMLNYTRDKLELTSCHFFVLTPFRGTYFHKQLLKDRPELFLTHNPDHYSIRQTVLQPLYMSVEEFHYQYAELQRKFNSDTIPFSVDSKITDPELEKEFNFLKSQNEKLYESIINAHLEYSNYKKQYFQSAVS